MFAAQAESLQQETLLRLLSLEDQNPVAWPGRITTAVYSIISLNASSLLPFLRWQQGQRWRHRTIPTISSLCSVVIEVGLCRSGRTGGSSGSSTSGNARFLESRLVSSSLRGEKATLRDQKGVGGYAHRRVVMKPAPLAPFVMPQADLLFELVVIALDSPA